MCFGCALKGQCVHAVIVIAQPSVAREINLSLLRANLGATHQDVGVTKPLCSDF